MEKEQKILIVRLCISAALLGLSFFHFLGSIGTLVVALVSFLVIGYDIVIESFLGIIKGKVFDERFLMLIASIGAFVLKEYHEAVAVMLLYQLGELLQDIAVDHSKASITKLLEFRSDYANIILNGEVKKVDPKTICVGDEILVFAGERVPLDGVIVSGKTSFDTSALTGESLPKDLESGNGVLAGYLNLSDKITVKVTSLFEDSSMSKIIQMVESADDKKSKSEKFITKFAKFYTPAVVVFALLLMLLPPLAFNQPWNVWIHRALLFLVVSCPCALVISIPLAFFVGIGGASKRGILIKGSNHIETLAKLSALGFDKTGTLTEGKFEVSKIVAVEKTEDEILRLCASVETGISHPIALAITELAKSKNLKLDEIKSQKNLAGLGVEAETGQGKVFVGNKKFMESIGLKTPKVGANAATVFVATDKILGFILISDKIKPESKNAIQELFGLNIDKITLLSGDKDEVARMVGEQAGIDEIYSNLLPEEKAKIVETMKSSAVTGFVGDGINDAPVLKIADVGISMGKLGSDIAIDSADVILTDDNIMKVPEAIKISRKTMRIAKENIAFSILFKLVMLVLGAVGIVSSMWFAVVADVGVSLVAILNSLRAFKVKTAKKKD